MPEYRITFSGAAHQEYERLDPPIARRILTAIKLLAAQPRPRGCVKLAGGSNHWRIRIGDWRVLYTIDDTARVVDVAAIKHRREAYR